VFLIAFPDSSVREIKHLKGEAFYTYFIRDTLFNNIYHVSINEIFFTINSCIYVILLRKRRKIIYNVRQAISVSNCITNYPTPRTYLLAIRSQYEPLFS